MDSGAGGENTDVLQQVLGHMVRRCIESGMVRREEMVNMLEDMIQSIERGTLQTVLECS
jgi:hypothetical protein